ncbi:MAG: AraC family ligand binding domain-containing protein, partial [Gorillibacterium sp.]|nr:AraC family ligand binding domain-containing protein [Gorillibacterium sp.]
MEYYVTSMFEKSLNVYYCGLDQTRPKHSCGPAMRSHFLLTYVLKGKGVFRTEGTTFHLEAGTSFVMFPGVVGYYQADSEDPWEYAWVGFGGEAAKTYVEEIGLSQKLPILHHLDRDWMSNWFQLLFEQAAQK